MKFTVEQMRTAQKTAVVNYENNIKEQICKRLRNRAISFPYSGKVTFIFADELKENNIRIERPEVFFVSLNIFTEDMFRRVADWLAAQGYMTRLDWFAEENNNNGDVGYITINWQYYEFYCFIYYYCCSYYNDLYF